MSSTPERFTAGLRRSACFRKALQWNGDSGALDKLRIKDEQAALTKLGQALDSLRSAQTADANVGTLIELIEQVIASLL